MDVVERPHEEDYVERRFLERRPGGDSSVDSQIARLLGQLGRLVDPDDRVSLRLEPVRHAAIPTTHVQDLQPPFR
jgi:hypothetical protein